MSDSWHWRRLATVVFGLLLGAGPANSSPGYLAMLGPSPLRFLTPSTNPPAILPPPVPVDKDNNPLSDGSASETKPAGDSEATPEPVPVEPTVPPGIPLDVSEIKPPADQQSSSMVGTNSSRYISPDMLLQFFIDHGASNRTSAVIAPLHFSPAVPPVAPSSTATYTSGPKQ